MIWRSILVAETGNVHNMDKIMNQCRYLQILKENVKDSVKKLGTDDYFNFYQDNHTKHKTYTLECDYF